MTLPAERCWGALWGSPLASTFWHTAVGSLCCGQQSAFYLTSDIRLQRSDLPLAVGSALDAVWKTSVSLHSAVSPPYAPESSWCVCHPPRPCDGSSPLASVMQEWSRHTLRCIPSSGAGIRDISAAPGCIYPTLPTHYMLCTYNKLTARSPAFLLCTTLPCLISPLPKAYHIPLCTSEPPELWLRGGYKWDILRFRQCY